METLVSIIAVILIAINLPLLVAVFMGIKLHTTSTCEEDIKAVKHNKMMLRGIALADVCIGVVLFIAML